MTTKLSTLLLAAFAFQLPLLPLPAEAIRFHRCESTGDYRPPKGVYKVFTRRIRTEWEHREHCLPCGGRVPYKVKVITFRERYSDGTMRTWKCDVRGTERTLGPPVRGYRK